MQIPSHIQPIPLQFPLDSSHQREYVQKRVGQLIYKHLGPYFGAYMTRKACLSKIECWNDS